MKKERAWTQTLDSVGLNTNSRNHFGGELQNRGIYIARSPIAECLIGQDGLRRPFYVGIRGHKWADSAG